MLTAFYGALDRVRNRLRRKRSDRGWAAGRRGEDLAHRLLRRSRYTVVARNYRPRAGHGEIDLIAWDRDVLVFVEVKSRSSNEFGSPDRAIDTAKHEELIHVAREYARRADVPWDKVRFDVVNVVLTDPPVATITQDALERYNTHKT
jgi:putative endonuclease